MRNKKMYAITKETAKKNILKFLENDDKTVDELFLFHAEDEDDEHNYYSLVKDFELYEFDYERYYDDEYIYEELTEEQRKNFEEKSLLRIFNFGTDYILTTDDVEKYKGKTLNHKIANYVIQDLS